MWQRIAGRIVTGPVAFALGGVIEAARYWRSRVVERLRGQARP